MRADDVNLPQDSDSATPAESVEQPGLPQPDESAPSAEAAVSSEPVSPGPVSFVSEAAPAAAAPEPEPHTCQPVGAPLPDGGYHHVQGLAPAVLPSVQLPLRRRRGVLMASVLAASVIMAGIGGGAVGAWAAGYTAAEDAPMTVPVAAAQDPGKPMSGVAQVATEALKGTVTIMADSPEGHGVGTGFIFDAQGNIMTNAHVVASTGKGTKLKVKFSDGASYPASVVGVAKGYDIAVVKLDRNPKKVLTPLPLGDSAKVAVGDPVIAAGAPFDLEGTITSGIISAVNRPVATGGGGANAYMNALQTDASINPGNSGGPLLDSSGAVIGVNSAIRSASAGVAGGQPGSIGLGFAIPINQAEWVANSLIRQGHASYAQLGILRNDSYRGDGVQIMPTAVDGQAPITTGGAAAKAGLKPGDVITSLGGVRVDDGPALMSELWAHRPGERVQVQYVRNGVTHTANVTLGERMGSV
ncbi:S1C family serine protease [Streptomyces sp. NPDC059985]|uniref:S1C family serine protease n=1 Tax=Streptomyces sp. NPDC059985 TaxID=3347025 RepID=UPI00367D3175